MHAEESVSGATPADVPGLMALEMSFPDSQRWSEDSWRAELAADNRHVIVCRDAADEVQAAATFAVSGDVVDLHRIVTRPAAQRRGHARHLLDAGIRWAQKVGATRMLLEVEATNDAALRLYESAGFRRISERRDYYGPGAHAVIMERSVLAVEGGETS